MTAEQKPAPVATQTVGMQAWGAAALVLVVVVSALKAGEGFFMPVALSIVLALALARPVRALARWVPRWIAAGVLVAMFVGFIGTTAYVLSDEAAQVISGLPQAARNFRQALRGLVSQEGGLLSQVQQAVREFQRTATESTSKPSTPTGVTAVQVVEPAVDVGNMVWLGSQGVRVPDPFVAAYQRRYGRDMREYWRDEGVQTAVSVHASQFRHSLYLDGLHQANDTPGMVQLHRIIGHLPMVLHPHPRNALVIGLGGGATSGAVSQHSNTKVQIVELSDGVRQAAQFFRHISYDVLNQPNVRLRVDDGRNFLLLSGEKFDVITADIIQPIHAGAGNLYSREYFSLVRNALEPDGLALQWIGERPPTQYRLIMRTFLDVFPEATLWFAGNLMVGSIQPLRVNPALVEAKRSDPKTRAALDDIGLRDGDVLRTWYTAGPAEMRRFVGDGPLLTDDRPLLEYHRSLPRDEAALDLSPLKSNAPFN